MPESPPLLILIHGSWLGGWCWQRLAGSLTDRGWRVASPTLTGLGDRQHLGGAATGLSDHVADILSVLDFAEPGPVILAGHSYGGLVAAEVAALRPDRVSDLVVIDGPIATKGQSLFDQVPEMGTLFNAIARDGMVPPPDAAFLGLDPGDSVTEWTLSRLRPMPLRTHAEPARYGAGALVCRRHYLRFTDFPPTGPLAALAQKDGWQVAEVAAGHTAIVTHPEPVAHALTHLLRSEPGSPA
ncbi:alpha/beta hydrolase [Niveispirillum sp.]|uniref:alpha/beta fold hydrolase n=1 Tax=Niveispirillum sp. TaxID=1917217 RepID=UPI001B3CC97A|nr:alpha/beta hydrolase [Niveispirillum sp.]MBP7337912.1 alpha/beta hydrolase [Niveispirillum sp.]